MRKFNITVNGTTYEVDVEEVGGAAPVARPVAQPARQAAPAAAPVQAPTPAVAPAAAPASKAPVAVGEGATTIVSPMPGTILDIKVSVGSMVNRGDNLLILEAMKMENDIMAPVGGKVVSINTTKGASVNSGEVLIVIE